MGCYIFPLSALFRILRHQNVEKKADTNRENVAGWHDASLCLTVPCNHGYAHTHTHTRHTNGRRTGTEYVHAGTTFVFIYVPESSLPRVLRETSRRPGVTVQCSPSDRHTRSRFRFIEIAAWLCSALPLPDLCAHLYDSRSVFYLDPTARSAERCTIHQRYIPRHDSRLIPLVLIDVYLRDVPRKMNTSNLNRCGNCRRNDTR